MSESVLAGIHAVKSALQKKPERIRRLLMSTDRKDKRMDEIRQLARASQIGIEDTDSRQLDQLTDGVRHQGVVLMLEEVTTQTEDDLYDLLDNLSQPAFLLVLDGVTDPHNLGACLRSADAAGVDAVIVPKDNSCGLTPVVRKVASGAAEAVPLIPVTNLARTLDDLKERGIWLTGTSDQSEQNIFEIDLTGSIAIILGAEGKGMRRLTTERCDHLAVIPMAGTVESLNVSVATGICLFEAVRQRVA